MNTSLGVRRRPKINIPLAKNAMSALIAIGVVLIVAPLILSNFQLSCLRPVWHIRWPHSELRSVLPVWVCCYSHSPP